MTRTAPARRLGHAALSTCLLTAVVTLAGCVGEGDPPAEPQGEAPAPVVLTGDEAAAAIEAGEAKAYPLNVCLVSDEPVDAMGSPLSIVYDRQEIQFCCPGCDELFLATPENYLHKLASADTSPSATDEAHIDHEGHAH